MGRRGFLTRLVLVSSELVSVATLSSLVSVAARNPESSKDLFMADFFKWLTTGLNDQSQGRSAFESPVSEVSQEAAVGRPSEDAPAPRSPGEDEDEQDAEQGSDSVSPQHDSLLAKSSSYEQQYNEKGYPENTSSKILKKVWRHGVNDVLATLGVCVAKGHESMPAHGACEPSRILQVRLENNFGIFVYAADSLMRFVSERWSTALRQRLQTFKFYAGIPLSAIITSEWKRFSAPQFLFSGTLSGLTFLILDTSSKLAIRYAFKALKQTTDGILTPGSRREKLKDIAFDYAEQLANLIFFALIAPLELYSTLQRLGLISEPLHPHPRAYSSGLWIKPVGERWLGYSHPLILQSLLYIWVRQNNGLEAQICDYFWAALPKPNLPDRVSLVGAQVDGYDSSSIAGLAPQDNTHDEWAHSTVTNRLASDLRSLGRNWQIFYDRCAQAFSWGHPFMMSSDLVDSTSDDQAVINRLRTELSRGQNNTYGPDTPTTATVQGSYGQEFLHNPPNHFSPPMQSPSTVQSRPETTGPPSLSNRSSPIPSLPASPRPIGLTSHLENGEVHVNLTLPAPPDTTRRIPMSDGERRARDPDTLPNNAALPEGVLRSTEPTDMERIDGSREPIAGTYRLHGSRHRVTALSAYPADSLAQRLSSLIMNTLCLPYEALFARSIAIAFLSMPSQSSVSEAAAASLKNEIYPLEAWFGPGLSAGGWKGVSGYVGKLVLVQGLEAGVGFVTWQIGMGIVWWVGRTWCEWDTSKRAGSVQAPRRVQREGESVIARN